MAETNNVKRTTKNSIKLQIFAAMYDIQNQKQQKNKETKPVKPS